ncbi:hypothetical protein [Cloacibacterium sp. TD35]|uniref:hypothetical protein n=1 Tax=Cloacibacterium sp. TD35 TaxID=2976818 RepID=UPI00237E34CA|nr:hypothetical protein [Cloacibacterium sp. TD35]WDT68882.1 hypothetical protein N7277_04535 [Cloacibacterium sp. TD35]
MKKRLLFLIFFSSFFSFQAQQNLSEIKKELLINLKTIQKNYENKTLDNQQILDFFCENFYCSVCENNSMESTIKFQEINNYLQDIIPIINYKNLRKSNIIYDSENNQYTLGYQTAKPNPKTDFEGASAILHFKPKNGKLKFCGILVIP